MRFKIPLIAVACLSSTAGLANGAEPSNPVPAFFTGARLYEICRQTNYGQCSMYVAGVVDGIFFADGENGGQALCRNKLTNQRAAELVLDKLANDSSLRSLSAAASVKAALADMLGCNEDQTLASTL